MDRPNTKFQPRPGGLVDELTALDLELMKLLVRRTKLLGKVRGGREHASTFRAVRGEKEVRLAWEKNAQRFSRDPLFVRQLFALLGEIKMSSREQAESRSAFSLAPARRPAAVSVPGPRSLTATRMLTVLAAATGSEWAMDNAVLSDGLIDCIKALNQCGAHLAWTAEGTLRNNSGESLTFADQVLYTGEDAFTFHLLLFLCVGRTGKTRFTGGSALKMADFSATRRFLPQLGARLMHAMPKSTGLPASVEASGVLPESVRPQPDMSREAILALVCAAACWPTPVNLDFSALPGDMVTAVMAEAGPVLAACSALPAMQGTALRLGGTPPRIPTKSEVSLDPCLSAYILALPGLTGGTVRLSGTWDTASPLSQAVTLLLGAHGVSVDREEGAVTSRQTDASGEVREVPSVLLPLAAVLAAKRAPGMLPPPQADQQDLAVLAEFADQLGLCFDERGFTVAQEAEEAPVWSAPSPWWGMALALGAFVRSGRKLANPGDVSELYPAFWPLFNGLPEPDISPRPKSTPAPTRRRIRTDVYSDPLPDLEAEDED